jgi:signal peptidase I
MFDKALKYSYSAQKRERYKFLRFLLAFLVLFLLYNTVNTFLFSVWVMRNDTMDSSLHAGDRFIVASSFMPSVFTGLKGIDGAFSFKRGSIVLLDTRREENRSWFIVAIDSFVRFITVQQKSILDTEEHLYIKRLIALPGDEISMNNYVLRVKPADSQYTFTEFELSDRPYYPNIPQVPAIWDASLPFSGYMDRIILGPGECFVISDDRGNSGDSRTWGPINTKIILGVPVLRFWPPGRIGRP